MPGQGAALGPERSSSGEKWMVAALDPLRGVALVAQTHVGTFRLDGHDARGAQLGRLLHDEVELLALQQRHDIAAALKQVRESRSEYVREFRSLHPDGSVHWLSARGRFVYDDEGNAVRMIGAMIETTEARELQESARR